MGKPERIQGPTYLGCKICWPSPVSTAPMQRRLYILEHFETSFRISSEGEGDRSDVGNILQIKILIDLSVLQKALVHYGTIIILSIKTKWQCTEAQCTDAECLTYIGLKAS